MIPKTIHYCWFGRSEMPQLAKDCIASWRKYMPDWEFKLWNEDNFDVNCSAYSMEAYKSCKFAFVSDVARLVALEREGGVYLDVDFWVYRSFDDLLQWDAFAGFEGSKHTPLMMGVIASKPHGLWVKEQLDAYQDRHFLKEDGRFDLTTNVSFVSSLMREHGFMQNGEEQDYKDLHIFPVEYFCPRQTTGEYLLTANTYCESLGLGSWAEKRPGWKDKFLCLFGSKNRTKMIKLKRKIFG